MGANDNRSKNKAAVVVQNSHHRFVTEPGGAPHSCGPRCLQEALFRLGVEARLPELIGRCKTAGPGTSIRDLLAAARSFGLGAQVCKAGIKLLRELVCSSDIVVIAHVQRDHFVLVETATEGGVAFWDPDEGTRRLPLGGFQAVWEGVCVVIGRPASP